VTLGCSAVPDLIITAGSKMSSIKKGRRTHQPNPNRPKGNNPHQPKGERLVFNLNHIFV